MRRKGPLYWSAIPTAVHDQAVDTAAGSTNVKGAPFTSPHSRLMPASTLGSLLKSMAPSDLGPALVPDAGGFLYINRAKFHDVFAKDVSPAEARIMAATQKPIFGAIFETPITVAAWKTIPSWYLVASEDHAINPDLERFMAKRIGAHNFRSEGKPCAFHLPSQRSGKNHRSRSGSDGQVINTLRFRAAPNPTIF